MRTRIGVLALASLATVIWTTAPGAQAPPQDGPAYDAGGRLLRPSDYREWVYLTSGLGMTYGPAQPAAGRPPLFDNVFVNPRSYREFMRSGTWPDKTMFVLEIRRAETSVSIDNGGRTQGDLAFIESAVKDTGRFPAGGWGYFSFDGPQGLAASAEPLPPTASCYACHTANTAVENTFVQFYPTLFAVAKAKGTVKPTYDPNRKP